MKQSIITDIEQISDYTNKHTSKKNYIYEITFANSDCLQYRTIQPNQSTYKVGQQLKYKAQKVGVNGSTYMKLIDLSKTTYKPKSNKAKDNSLYKCIDVAVQAQKQAILMLKNEIDQTIDLSVDSPIMDKITAITERLYQDVFTISKL